MDGGAFITLPQVYSEDPTNPGIKSANIGMYRVRLTGNEYEKDKEIGLHYQIQRGIGVHQTEAKKKGAFKGQHLCWGTTITHIISCDATT